jgi:hypothetical protein
MAEKEWYTLQDLVSLWGVPYSRVRGAVFFLRNQGTIKWRDNPTDARVLEVHRDSLDAVKGAAGAK